MRHPAGQLTHGFHLLSLTQLRFGFGPLGNGGGDALFQHFVRLLQDLFGVLPLGYVDDRRYSRETPHRRQSAAKRR